MKRPAFQKAISFFTRTADWVTTILRNRIIAAVLLLIQGISFISDPSKSGEGMVKSIAMTVAFASAVSAIGSITAKEKGPSSHRSLVLSVLLLIVSVLCWFKPQGLDILLRIAIAVTAIYTGIINLLQVMRLEKLKQDVEQVGKKTKNAFKILSEKIADQFDPDDTEQLDDTIEDAVNEHIEKRWEPVRKLIRQTSGSKFFTAVVNIVIFSLGILLIIYPFTTNTVMMIASGITMIVSGISNLWTAWEARKAEMSMRNRSGSECRR